MTIAGRSRPTSNRRFARWRMPGWPHWREAAPPPLQRERQACRRPLVGPERLEHLAHESMANSEMLAAVPNCHWPGYPSHERALCEVREEVCRAGGRRKATRRGVAPRGERGHRAAASRSPRWPARPPRPWGGSGRPLRPEADPDPLAEQAVYLRLLGIDDGPEGMLAVAPKAKVFEEHVQVRFDAVADELSAVERDGDRPAEIDEFR
jgi:hypothetical protein